MTPSSTYGTLDPTVASLLALRLLNQGLFLTYRLLSRELALHGQEARAALLTFYEQQGKEILKACWIVRGTLAIRAKQDGRRDMERDDVEQPGMRDEAILLVGDDKLQETKALFSPAPTVQIYSLSPASSTSPGLSSTDLANISTVPLLLSSEPKYLQAWEQAGRGSKLGVLYNDKVSEGDPRAVAAAQEQAQLQVKAQKAVQPPAGPSKLAKEEKVAEESSATTSTSRGNKNSGLDWSKAKSSPVTTTHAAPAPPSEGSRSKKTTFKATSQAAPEDDDANDSDVEMAQIGYADSDGEADDTPSVATKTKRADGVAASKSTAGGKGTGAKAAGAKVAAKGKSASKVDLEKMMDSDMDEDEAGEAIPDIEASDSAATSLMQGNDKDDAESSKPAPVKRKVRRRKRTVRKERTKDEKGYMRTQEISDYESYSDWTDSEQTPPAKQKAKLSGNAIPKSKTARKPSASSAEPASRARKTDEVTADVGADTSAGKSTAAASAEAQPSSADAAEARESVPAPALAKPSKSPSPSKQGGSVPGVGQKSGKPGGPGSGSGSGSAKGAAAGGAKSGQSKLSSFFKKG